VHKECRVHVTAKLRIIHMGDPGPHLTHGFLGTRKSAPFSDSTGSAVSAAFTVVTNKQTT